MYNPNWLSTLIQQQAPGAINALARSLQAPHPAVPSRPTPAAGPHPIGPTAPITHTPMGSIPWGSYMNNAANALKGVEGAIGNAVTGAEKAVGQALTSKSASNMAKASHGEIPTKKHPIPTKPQKPNQPKMVPGPTAADMASLSPIASPIPAPYTVPSYVPPTPAGPSQPSADSATNPGLAKAADLQQKEYDALQKRITENLALQQQLAGQHLPTPPSFNPPEIPQQDQIHKLADALAVILSGKNAGGVLQGQAINKNLADEDYKAKYQVGQDKFKAAEDLYGTSLAAQDKRQQAAALEGDKLNNLAERALAGYGTVQAAEAKDLLGQGNLNAKIVANTNRSAEAKARLDAQDRRLYATLGFKNYSLQANLTQRREESAQRARLAGVREEDVLKVANLHWLSESLNRADRKETLVDNRAFNALKGMDNAVSSLVKQKEAMVQANLGQESDGSRALGTQIQTMLASPQYKQLMNYAQHKFGVAGDALGTVGQLSSGITDASGAPAQVGPSPSAVPDKLIKLAIPNDSDISAIMNNVASGKLTPEAFSALADSIGVTTDDIANYAIAHHQKKK